MDNFNNQKPLWYTNKKSILFENIFSFKKQLRSKCQNKRGRNFNAGFSILEMLLWLSFLMIIITGYFSIFKTQNQEINLIIKEFEHGRKKINAERRDSQIL